MADVVDPQEGADNLEVEERPSWLPANFNSPEDMAKSYTEAQRKITELSTQYRGLEESYGELSQQFEAYNQQAQQPAYDPNADPLLWAAEQAYEQGDFRTAQMYNDQRTEMIVKQALEANQPKQAPQKQGADQIAALVARTAYQDLAAKYDDIDEYGDRASELIRTHPVFRNLDPSIWQNLEGAHSITETAYKMAKAEDVLSGHATQQQQLADTRQMKLQAQSAQGGAGRPGTPEYAEQRWQEIMGAKSDKLGF